MRDFLFLAMQFCIFYIRKRQRSSFHLRSQKEILVLQNTVWYEKLLCEKVLYEKLLEDCGNPACTNPILESGTAAWSPAGLSNAMLSIRMREAIAVIQTVVACESMRQILYIWYDTYTPLGYYYTLLRRVSWKIPNWLPFIFISLGLF